MRQKKNLIYGIKLRYILWNIVAFTPNTPLINTASPPFIKVNSLKVLLLDFAELTFYGCGRINNYVPSFYQAWQKVFNFIYYNKRDEGVIQDQKYWYTCFDHKKGISPCYFFISNWDHKNILFCKHIRNNKSNLHQPTIITSYVFHRKKRGEIAKREKKKRDKIDSLSVFELCEWKTRWANCSNTRKTMQ